jgi:hypothetical protein
LCSGYPKQSRAQLARPSAGIEEGSEVLQDLILDEPGAARESTSLDNLWCYVYLQLHRIMYAASQVAFNNMWAAFVEEEFEHIWPEEVNYLRKYYFDDDLPTLWAMCWRTEDHYDENTSNKLESIHNLIKNVFLDAFRSRSPIRLLHKTVGHPVLSAMQYASLAFAIHRNLLEQRAAPHTSAAGKQRLKRIEQAAWVYACAASAAFVSAVPIKVNRSKVHASTSCWPLSSCPMYKHFSAAMSTYIRGFLEEEPVRMALSVGS